MLRGLIWITMLAGVAILAITGVIAGTRADHLANAWIVRGLFVNTPSIFLERFDQRDLRRLTDDEGYDEDPVVSPDRQWILFTSDREGWSGYYLMRTDGSDPHWLAEFDFTRPAVAWSPDSQQIAFMSKWSGGLGLFAVRRDGNDLRQLTGSSLYMSSFAWSPDSQQIALEALQMSTGQGDVYAIRADGSGLVQLTDDRPWDGLPYWSADGQWILFSSFRDLEGSSSTYRIRPDGSGLESVPFGVSRRNDPPDNRLPADFPFHPLLPIGIALAMLGGAVMPLARRTFYARIAPR